MSARRPTYRKGETGAWQDSPTFEGLAPETTYTFYARMKETDTHSASPASEGLSVTVQEARAELHWLTVNGDTVSIENNESKYMAGCGADSVVLDIGTTAHITVNGDASIRKIKLTGDLKEIFILLTGGDGQTYEHTLKIMKPIDAYFVLFQRWDDVISLIRNPNNK